MAAITPISIDIRSYGRDAGADRHDFAQLVLPLSGTLAMDVAGREARLDPMRAAFVPPGADHSQASDGPNRSLILDLDAASLDCAEGELLVGRGYVSLSPAAGRLVDYMGLLRADGAVTDSVLRLWVPLMLDAMLRADDRPRSRLAVMLAAVEAEPGLPWTAAMMAERAGLSVSRLHAVFRAELATSPRAWLAELRLRRVREGLARTDLSIAELAYRAGYADQSALTRAMRRATGMTPAAWRRLHQEPGHKLR